MLLRYKNDNNSDAYKQPNTRLQYIGWQRRYFVPYLCQQVARVFCRHLVCNTHTQPFNGLWSGTTRVGQYQKKHSPTHNHPDHRTSFINFLHLQRSIASFVQFTSLTVFSDNLSPGTLWSSSWSWNLYFTLHAFLHPVIIFFSQHMPTPTQPVPVCKTVINVRYCVIA